MAGEHGFNPAEEVAARKMNDLKDEIEAAHEVAKNIDELKDARQRYDQFLTAGQKVGNRKAQEAEASKISDRERDSGAGKITEPVKKMSTAENMNAAGDAIENMNREQEATAAVKKAVEGQRQWKNALKGENSKPKPTPKAEVVHFPKKGGQGKK